MALTVSQPSLPSVRWHLQGGGKQIHERWPTRFRLARRTCPMWALSTRGGLGLPKSTKNTHPNNITALFRITDSGTSPTPTTSTPSSPRIATRQPTDTRSASRSREVVIQADSSSSSSSSAGGCVYVELLQQSYTYARKGALIFSGVGIVLDFVRPTTRTMHPHGGASYARRAKRNRIDPPPSGRSLQNGARRVPGWRRCRQSIS